MVPRAVVRNRLDLFARELVVLEKIFGVLSELATGSRPSFQIRTFSSSELTIVFASMPAVAAAIALAVERVITTYKRLLEIRLLPVQRTLKQDIFDFIIFIEIIISASSATEYHQQAPLSSLGGVSMIFACQKSEVRCQKSL